VIAHLSRAVPSEPLVRLSGEIDGDLHGIIEHTIADAARDASTVHLDLTAVDFMGSAGLQVLVRSARAMEAHGRRLTIDRASSIVRRVLEVTQLTDVFGLPSDDGSPGR
jgi:anti-sigma B factor antagonist